MPPSRLGQQGAGQATGYLHIAGEECGIADDS